MNGSLNTVHVTVRPVSLMSEPIIDDPLQPMFQLRESQVLYGHPVRLVSEHGAFAYVEVISQPYCSARNWSGYMGYVEHAALVSEPSLAYLGRCANLDVAKHPRSGASSLALGSIIVGEVAGEWIRLISGHTVHRDVLSVPEGQRFWRQWLNVPYVWGGCLVDGGNTSGIDCSGLVWSLASALGVELPRNAHDQWLMGVEVDHQRPTLGDLLFLHAENGRCRHVALCVGEDLVLDAAEAYTASRVVPFSDLFWWQRELCTIKRIASLSNALQRLSWARSAAHTVL